MQSIARWNLRRTIYSQGNLQTMPDKGITAVRQDQEALEYLSLRLRNNQFVVRNALHGYLFADLDFTPLSFASEEIQDNFDIVIEAVAIFGLKH